VQSIGGISIEIPPLPIATVLHTLMPLGQEKITYELQYKVFMRHNIMRGLEVVLYKFYSIWIKLLENTDIMTIWYFVLSFLWTFNWSFEVNWKNRESKKG